MPHFAERFNIQPFVIHDLNRGLFGVYDRQDWRIVRADSVTLPPMTADERECRRLWKTFFDAVAIPGAGESPLPAPFHAQKVLERDHRNAHGYSG